MWATFFYDRIFALGIAKANLRRSVLSKQSESVKDRILGAVTIMNEDDVQKPWNIITQTFGSGWGNIEEVMPDSWDMQMISEMKADLECRQFVSEKDVMDELGLA